MKLTIDGFDDNAPIPGDFAFGLPDADQHLRLGPNRNPGVRWQDLPEGTRSLVLVCVDPDVPSKPDDVNQEGREVPTDLPRVDFYHWVMVDIDPAAGGIKAGACSDGITAGGKKNPPGPEGARQGLNDYTAWFEGDADMGGEYYGYDGPCPPWNDRLRHRYEFRLYATDLERVPVDGAFRGPDVEQAIKGHVLAEAVCTGLYTLNPEVRL